MLAPVPDILANRMSRPVHEILAEAPLGNVSARCVIHLVAGNRLVPAHRPLYRADRRVARSRHDAKDVHDFSGRGNPGEAGPRDVVVDVVGRLGQPRPHIEQHYVTGKDRQMLLRWLVVRIRRIRIYRRSDHGR